MSKLCDNCTFFDGSKHQNDSRTSHAGICSKWSEIVFRSETCKQYISVLDQPKEKIQVPLIDVKNLPNSNQLTFF